MNIEGLLLDLDGTLYEDDDPIEGAPEALSQLKASGLILRYVTNTTRKPRSAIYQRLTSLGFDIEEDEILTPARVAARLIGDRTCFPLLDEALLEDLGEIHLTGESPDYVLVGDLGEGFTYGRLNEAFRMLMDGAELLALQKNRYWSTGGELSLDAGPFVAALEYANGKSATVVGKPEENFFRLALEEMQLEPGDVAMVGDDPVSDVAGAQAAGLYGIQVKTGKYRPGKEDAPDLTIESFARLPEALDA
ncbi:TIGR01458 family HAD-type hydrolase [soil metagenome]